MRKDMMIAHKRLEVLLNKVYPTLNNYPKNEHQVICNEIKHNYFKAMENISDYIHTKDKCKIKVSEGHLLNLKTLNSISNENKFISEGFFKEVSTELTEISKLL